MPSLATHETTLRSYVLENVERTLKAPNRMMRHPFIDPGSVYEGNLWDWDSYWASCALLSIVDESVPNGAVLRRRCLEHARGNVLNFLDHQEPDGYIPMMVQESDYPVPYLVRKHREGAVLNMHKPFLCQQIRLVSEAGHDFSWVAPLFDGVDAYLRHYARVYRSASCGLYVWADDVMIGNDNDPAVFGRPPFTTAGMFLNGFMVAELEAAAAVAGKLGRAAEADRCHREAAELAAAVAAECWDERDGFFYSVDVDVKTRPYDWFHKGLGVFWKTLPIKVRTWPGFLPLWNRTATPAQAQRLAAHAEDEATFCAPFGICSLARDEKMFSLQATINPSNWLGPAWVVSTYVVFRGLLNYGYRDEATRLCGKTLALLGGDLRRTGTLHEFYDPFTGEPIMNPGFLNWNMLALTMAAELRGQPTGGPS